MAEHLPEIESWKRDAAEEMRHECHKFLDRAHELQDTGAPQAEIECLRGAIRCLLTWANYTHPKPEPDTRLRAVSEVDDG